jgi:hypothetical protein
MIGRNFEVGPAPVGGNFLGALFFLVFRRDSLNYRYELKLNNTPQFPNTNVNLDTRKRCQHPATSSLLAPTESRRNGAPNRDARAAQAGGTALRQLFEPTGRMVPGEYSQLQRRCDHVH